MDIKGGLQDRSCRPWPSGLKKIQTGLPRKITYDLFLKPVLILRARAPERKHRGRRQRPAPQIQEAVTENDLKIVADILGEIELHAARRILCC